MEQHEPPCVALMGRVQEELPAAVVSCFTAGSYLQMNNHKLWSSRLVLFEAICWLFSREADHE
jgi:hypothetical protein